MIRLHGIAQTDVKLKSRARKRLQTTREALKIEHAFAPPTPMEAAPPAERPSLVVKISHLRKPSQESQQEVTVPQNPEASAPQAPSTLDPNELPLADKKAAAKKRSHKRKACVNDGLTANLKKKKQWKANMFEDKTEL